MLLEADTKLRGSTGQLDVLSLRVTVVRVEQGSRTVTFESEHEGRFILDVTGATLHEGHEYEVTAEVEQNHGRLLELEQVESLAPADEKKRWREWFGQAGADWENVEDIEVELGRPSIRACSPVRS